MKKTPVRLLFGLGLLGLGLAVNGISPAEAASTERDSLTADDLIIYHVEGRRSRRVAWLCEELGLPYTLVFKRGDVPGSFATLREVNPAMPVAPSVLYRGRMLVESGAILDYLLSRYGEGQLEPDVNSVDYLYHQQWLHFSEGSAFPVLFSEGRGGRYAAIGPARTLASSEPSDDSSLRTEQTMEFIEDYIGRYPYFGGGTFSIADIMMHYIIFLAPRPEYFALDMSKYPNFNAWQERVESRPAFIAARLRALPDNEVPGLAPMNSPSTETP